METISKSLFFSSFLSLPPSSRRLSILKLCSSVSLKPQLPKSHLSLNPHNQRPRPKHYLFQTITNSAIAAALAFSFALLPRPIKPALASAPISESESLPESLTRDAKVRELEDHLASNPDDAKGLRSLMELYIKSNRVPDAIAVIDRLMPLETYKRDLALLKAHLHCHAGDSEAAKRAFEDLLSGDPFLVEAYHGLVMVAYESENNSELGEVLKRVERAMEKCKKERRKEELRDFKLLVAQIRVVEGKYEDALKVYEGMVKEEPRDFRPYLCQGIIYSMLMKKDEAEKQFEKYRRLVPRAHPYAQYFDDNVIAMKVFSQIEENKRSTGASKN